MNWAVMKRWFGAGSKASADHDPLATMAAEVPGTPAIAERKRPAPREAIAGARSSERKHQRTRLWRRRALLRKGARLYSAIAWNRNFVSLAMLDEDGLVVGWYERRIDATVAERPLMESHVSQLYTAEDVAHGIPLRELTSARAQGESIHTGWRLGGDGVKFWATTTIRAVLLRDGRLQGFSHATDRLPAPWRSEGAFAWRWPWPFKIAKAEPRRRSLGARPGSGHSPALRRRPGSAVTAALVACLAFGAAPALAAKAARSMPDNATASEYGSGWECSHGFQRVRDVCQRITVPTNGYLDASGNRWRCDRGYISAAGGCALIKVPANAYLDDSYGSGWRCERRYRERLGACVLIEVPANAHETDSSYGPGWECSHGYVTMSGRCHEVRVPANAYLARSGSEWKCDRGFAQTKDGCVEIPVPQHGYVDAQGNGWSCDRGFRKTSSDCAPINVPANAHLDYTGDRWTCDRGFDERDATCVKQ